MNDRSQASPIFRERSSGVYQVVKRDLGGSSFAPRRFSQSEHREPATSVKRSSSPKHAASERTQRAG